MRDVAKKTFWLEFQSSKVDREKGVIRDVRVITRGPAMGHGVIVDDKTLQQVHAAMIGRPGGGLKSKLNHGYDASAIIGKMTNPRMDPEAGCVTADMKLLKASPNREYIFELAEECPCDVGMSISFCGDDEKIKDGPMMGQYAARCEELYSCDLVDRPAANKGGMFCQLEANPGASVDTSKGALVLQTHEDFTMTDKEFSDFKEAQAKLIQANTDALAAIQETVKELAAKPTITKLDVATLVVEEFAKLGVASAGRVSAPSPAPTAPKKFQELVKERMASANEKEPAALTFCINNHPAEYVAYRRELGVRMKSD